MGCRYASSAVQLMDHDLFVLSLSLAFPLVSPTAVLFCGHIGLGLPGAIPPPPQEVGEGNCAQAQGAACCQGLAQVYTHQIQAVRNADDGFNLILPL